MAADIERPPLSKSLDPPLTSITVLFEIHQGFKGYIVNELRISFNNPLALQFHRKTTVLKYLFNKSLGLQLYKKRL